MLGSTRMFAVGFNRGSVWTMHGIIVGTAAAGAAVAVRGEIVSGYNNIFAADANGNYAAVNFATNGALVLGVGAKFDSSSGSNNATCVMAKYTRITSA